MPPRKRRRTDDKKSFLDVPFLANARFRAKDTSLYTHRSRQHTVKTARSAAKTIGERKWYSMKKNDLVISIVIDEMARKIQRLFKTRGQNIHARESMHRGLRGETCPITLSPISELPIHNRYLHSNCWFDRESLAVYLRTSCDFVHPVTRVKFTLEDIKSIDTTLVLLFENRESLRSCIVSRIETIQCIENELEDIFSEMIEMASSTPTRNEFNVSMSYSEVQFEQCFRDLVTIDRGRCILALKSLPDLLRGAYISRKRTKALRELVKEFIFRANHQS